VVELRPYQADAIDAIRTELRGKRSTLLVLATGLGKTIVFSEIIRRCAGSWRCLVLAHREELLKQAQSKLATIGVESALEQGENRAGDAAVVVASVQTLRGARLEGFAEDAFQLIVVDEAHHACADGYRAVLDRFAKAKVLGVTATPDRLDGAGLGRVFESVAFRYELRKAIHDGFLAPLKAERIRVEAVNLEGIPTLAGDLQLGALAERMNRPAAVHGIAKPLAERVGDRQAIVFAVDVAHAHALALAINTYRPGSARAIDGTASAAVRADVVEQFMAGTLQILVNCALYTEGFDAPRAACIAIARPTKSRALYSQMIGRGTRLFPGKDNCLLLDFVGIVGKHRLACPADCLADEVKQPMGVDELEELEEMLGDQMPADLQADLAKLRRKASVKYSATTVDPFNGEHGPAPAIAAFNARSIIPLLGELHLAPPRGWTRDPASEKQIAALQKAGIEVPTGATKGDAAVWLGMLNERRERSLCTYKQAKQIKRLGRDPRTMTFDEASNIISASKDRW
jgi:superfamily II DNA or RNA helicase